MATTTMHFAADDPRLGTVGERTGGTIRLRSEAGFGLFGPYVDLPPGHCTARILFAGPSRGRVTLDILSERNVVLSSRPVDLGALDGAPAVITTVLDSAQGGCEVRLLCEAEVQADIAAVQIEIREVPDQRYFQSIVFGTTGLCNASCIHCPTNKAETAHLASRTMPLELFCGVIDQIADGGWRVTSNLSLGLFGDGLLDEFVTQRCAYARQRRPTTPIAVNTNGAAYNRAKHRVLRETVSAIALHVESFRPEVYNRLMYPLRFDRVFPRIQMIMEDFGRLVTPSTPLHRLNIDEFDEMLTYYAGAGATSVHFAPLSNRCSDSIVFAEMAFLPHCRAPCRGDVANNLVVDWDGQVFLCCNDFQKQFPIGDLTIQSLEEVMQDERRLAAAEHLAAGRPEKNPTCAKCVYDMVEPTLCRAHFL